MSIEQMERAGRHFQLFHVSAAEAAGQVLGEQQPSQMEIETIAAAITAAGFAIVLQKVMPSKGALRAAGRATGAAAAHSVSDQQPEVRRDV